jgi:hypothetical protein
MGVNSNQYLQGINQTTGTGAPVHSAVAGDRYTDTATGITYQYTTSWQTVSYSAGGLTYFTEAQSTASPNATVNVDSLTAVASTTNADFAIVSKGTGALTRQIPDGTATGGNKRGTYSVDLQTDRFNANNVASGSYSSLLGGQANTSSGLNSTVIGGYANSATNDYSVACGGGNQARGVASFAGGSSSTCYNPNDFVFGNTCIISNFGYYSNVNMGKSNTINSGLASTVFGESNIISNFYQFAAGNNHRLTSGSGSASLGISTMDDGYGRSMYGRLGWVRGDTQSSKIILNRRTTDATASVLVIDSPAGNTPVVGNQMTLQNNNVFRVKGSITGKQSASTNVGVWDIDCIIIRGANAASTVIGGTPSVSLILNTGSFGTPTLTANTTLGCLTVTVIGALATNVQWTCVIDTCEVIYA